MLLQTKPVLPLPTPSTILVMGDGRIQVGQMGLGIDLKGELTDQH